MDFKARFREQLAELQNPSGKKVKRSTSFLADFDNGYTYNNRLFAQGWYFAIGDWFKESLDIRETGRVIKKSKPNNVGPSFVKETIPVWTQGLNFSFNSGATFYDAPEAYAPIWRDALPHVNLCLEVVTPGDVLNVAVLTINEDRSRVVTRGRETITPTQFVEILALGPSAEWVDKYGIQPKSRP